MSVGEAAAYLATFIAGGGLGGFVGYIVSPRADRDKAVLERERLNLEHERLNFERQAAVRQRREGALQRLDANVNDIMVGAAARSGDRLGHAA